jgi:amidohydrolase
MVIKNICKGLGCDCEFKYIKRFPLTYNDKVLTEKVINILKDS